MSLPAPLSDDALSRLFRGGRSFTAWTQNPVAESTLRDLYDLMKMGPTSANSCPLRLIFLTTEAAKARMLPHLAEGNIQQSVDAPVIAILANDMDFPQEFPKLFPVAASWFHGKPELIEETAIRNASLQGGYFILAARALGLDCGPISGFDASGVNRDFFPDGRFQVNFLCNLGYGDASKLRPRLPRLTFEECCQVF